MTEAPTEAQINERKRWARALISGNYEQGKGALCVKTQDDPTLRYCCLGVRLHQVNPDDFSLEMPATADLQGRYQSTNGELSEPELAALGWTAEDQEAAVQFNDEDDWTFGMIARGIGWTTQEDVPFAHLYSRETAQDAYPGDELEPLTVPDSFSLEAWLES